MRLTRRVAEDRKGIFCLVRNSSHAFTAHVALTRLKIKIRPNTILVGCGRIARDPYEGLIQQNRTISVQSLVSTSVPVYRYGGTLIGTRVHLLVVSFKLFALNIFTSHEHFKVVEDLNASLSTIFCMRTDNLHDNHS